MSKALHILGRISIFVLGLALQATDRYIDFLLRIRAGERALPKTRRIRFPHDLRQRIRQQQDGLCMYCGVRLNRGNMHIDHIYPVEHGGSNAPENLQALCAPCNIRKGVQTDSEFRHRYRPLLSPVLPGRRRMPPRTRIPQSAFREITARTSQSDATRARRVAVFKTPRQKIVSGSAITGIAVCIIWLVAIAAAFGDVGDVALLVGVVLGTAVAAGLIWRAKRTGRFDL